MTDQEYADRTLGVFIRCFELPEDSPAIPRIREALADPERFENMLAQLVTATKATKGILVGWQTLAFVGNNLFCVHNWTIATFGTDVIWERDRIWGSAHRASEVTFAPDEPESSYRVQYVDGAGTHRLEIVLNTDGTYVVNED